MGSTLRKQIERVQQLRENLRALVNSWAKSAAPIVIPKDSVNASFFIEHGDLKFIENGWYVTLPGYSGLHAGDDAGIQVETVDALCDSAANRFVLKAVVYPSQEFLWLRRLWDADPSNVSALVREQKMRIAETRAVNRRFEAYGLGICSIEEIGTIPLSPRESLRSTQMERRWPEGSDRSAKSFRQHQLDAELVKPMPVDYCGSKTLLDATREQVETSSRELADWARKIVCPALPAQSYARQKTGGGRNEATNPGLSENCRAREQIPEGIFLVASTCPAPLACQKTLYAFASPCSNPCA